MWLCRFGLESRAAGSCFPGFGLARCLSNGVQVITSLAIIVESM